MKLKRPPKPASKLLPSKLGANRGEFFRSRRAKGLPIVSKQPSRGVIKPPPPMKSK